MTPATEIQSPGPKTFDFVLFCVGPFLLGAPATQVVRVGIGKMFQMDSDMEPVSLRDIFHLPPNDGDFSPAFLEVNGESGPAVISVDTVEGIVSLNLAQIKRLPPLVDFHKAHSFLWGLALLDEKIAFLLDPDRLQTGDK